MPYSFGYCHGWVFALPASYPTRCYPSAERSRRGKEDSCAHPCSPIPLKKTFMCLLPFLIRLAAILLAIVLVAILLAAVLIIFVLAAILLAAVFYSILLVAVLAAILVASVLDSILLTDWFCYSLSLLRLLPGSHSSCPCCQCHTGVSPLSRQTLADQTSYCLKLSSPFHSLSHGFCLCPNTDSLPAIPPHEGFDRCFVRYRTMRIT